MKHLHLHYSWAICLGCTIMLLVTGGLCVNAFSVVLPYILEQNDFTSTQTSFISTVRMLAYLICMLLTPAFYRLLGYRLGMTASCIFGALSFLVFAFAKSLPAYYLGGVLSGVAYGFGSMVPASILITRWFRARHGLALGLCSAGTGFALIAFSPIMTTIIETHSLFSCFLFLCAVCVSVAIIVFILVRESPEKCGKTPYGRSSLRGSAQTRISNTVHFGKLRWAFLFLATLLLGAITSPGCTHLMVLFKTSGFRASDAALSVSLFGFALMVGKCFYGAACDKLGGRGANWLFSALLFVGLAFCALSDCKIRILMFAGSILFGAGVPMSTVGLSVWSGAFATPKRYGATVRLFQVGYGLGSLIFSVFPGIMADRFGSYAPAYLAFILFGMFSLAVVQNSYRKVSRA